MGKLTVQVLSEEAQKELEALYRDHSSAAVRQRAQIILLKAKGRSAAGIAAILGTTEVSAYGWLKRFRTEGAPGLLTRPGRGRRSILCPDQDAATLLSYVNEHRHSLKQARAAYEAASGKTASEETFRFFLKALATPIKGYEDR